MRKMYGQNFLVNAVIRKALLDALKAEKGSLVWEIGPGLGAMTAGLLEKGVGVTAFEIDKGFIAVLEEFFGGVEGFTLVSGNVMKTWPKTASLGDYLLSNLPYNIGAALLADFIEKKRFFKRMVVTVQREVARRMAALPGTEDYSSFSVLCASAYKIKLLSGIKGAAFYPEPRVDSQGVLLEKRDDIDPASYPQYFKPIVRSLFSSRRKTIQNNLKTFVSSIIGHGTENSNTTDAREITAALLADTGIAGTERAERLGIGEFCALAGALERVLENGGIHG
jgi:16S rRNA (adenine1518-N6/adenine1519-N6)-dimethyltransferase